MVLWMILYADSRVSIREAAFEAASVSQYMRVSKVPRKDQDRNQVIKHSTFQVLRALRTYAT